MLRWSLKQLLLAIVNMIIITTTVKIYLKIEDELLGVIDDITKGKKLV